MAANLRLGRKVSAHMLCLPCCSLAPPSAAHLAVISVIYILKPEIYFPGQKARVRWHHHHLIWAWVLMPMAETNKAHYPFLLTPGGCTVTSAILGARKWEWEIMFSHHVSLFPWPGSPVLLSGSRNQTWSESPEASTGGCRHAPNMGPGHTWSVTFAWHVTSSHKCHETHPTKVFTEINK